MYLAAELWRYGRARGKWLVVGIAVLMLAVRV